MWFACEKFVQISHTNLCVHNALGKWVTRCVLGSDENTWPLHQQSEEEMPAWTGAESREAAAHRDAGEVPGRPALAGRGPDAGSAGTAHPPALF